jgi:predicted NAD/FAD-binding protein
MKRIAVIGGGISGLVSANLLSQRYEVTLFEANDYLGGHANTIDVELDGTRYSIDTGFTVFNKKTYPNFCRLLEKFNVATHPGEMSFSFRSDAMQLEYNWHNINTLFSDRRNLFNPDFYRFMNEIRRFNKDAKRFLRRAVVTDVSIGDFIRENDYSSLFIHSYLIPMIAAIWSSDPDDVMHNSAHFVLQFYANHGLLSAENNPEWLVITGGARNYIPPLIKNFQSNIQLNSKIERVERKENSVVLKTQKDQFTFDAVVMAVHSDQALHMLGDPTYAEQEVLSAIPYTKHDVILHTDSSLLPRKRLAWAGCNYYDNGSARTTLTYYMNKLQQLDASHDFCMSVNLSDLIDKEKVIKRFHYAHPCFSRQAVKAQQLHHHISGMNNTYYCGAYWGYGFHEDGVKSAMNACQQLGVIL